MHVRSDDYAKFPLKLGQNGSRNAYLTQIFPKFGCNMQYAEFRSTEMVSLRELYIVV